jgi:hypothetical protein
MKYRSVYECGARERGQQLRISGGHLPLAAVPFRPPIGTALAHILLLIALLAGMPAHAQLPWRIGAPEVVWRYGYPEGHDIRTLAVHPEGGVVVVARELYGHITLFRISASGSKLWERTIAVRGWGLYAHLAFLRGDQGVETIVAAPGTVVMLDPTGAVRWTRSATEIGIDSIGVAIADHTPAGDRIVVGGEGVDEDGRALPMAAGLTSDGTRRWLAVGPWRDAADSARLSGDDARSRDPTTVLPLQLLDDGGAVMLVGCGPLDHWDWPPGGREQQSPCSERPRMSLVTIDGGGQSTSIVVSGTEPWRTRFDRWDLQRATWVDGPLEPRERALPWSVDADELPRVPPFIWWFGPSAPRIVGFLRRWIYPRSDLDWPPWPLVAYDGERTSPQSPRLATFPAADLVVDGEVAYVVLAPARGYGPRRIILLAARRRGLEVLAARATPALYRVRYAPHEGALYALLRTDVVRMRVVRPANVRLR